MRSPVAISVLWLVSILQPATAGPLGRLNKWLPRSDAAASSAAASSAAASSAAASSEAGNPSGLVASQSDADHFSPIRYDKHRSRACSRRLAYFRLATHNIVARPFVFSVRHGSSSYFDPPVCFYECLDFSANYGACAVFNRKWPRADADNLHRVRGFFFFFNPDRRVFSQIHCLGTESDSNRWLLDLVRDPFVASYVLATNLTFTKFGFNYGISVIVPDSESVNCLSEINFDSPQLDSHLSCYIQHYTTTSTLVTTSASSASSTSSTRRTSSTSSTLVASSTTSTSLTTSSLSSSTLVTTSRSSSSLVYPSPSSSTLKTTTTTASSTSLTSSPSSSGTTSTSKTLPLPATSSSTSSSPSSSTTSSSALVTPGLNTIVPSVIVGPLPTHSSALNPSTYAKNLEYAKRLNELFTPLTLGDKCQHGQVVCLGSRAQGVCRDGTYAEVPCASGQICAALPMDGVDGVMIGCQNPDKARQILNGNNMSVSTTSLSSSVMQSPSLTATRSQSSAVASTSSATSPTLKPTSASEPVATSTRQSPTPTTPKETTGVGSLISQTSHPTSTSSQAAISSLPSTPASSPPAQTTTGPAPKPSISETSSRSVSTTDLAPTRSSLETPSRPATSKPPPSPTTGPTSTASSPKTPSLPTTSSSPPPSTTATSVPKSSPPPPPITTTASSSRGGWNPGDQITITATVSHSLPPITSLIVIPIDDDDGSGGGSSGGGGIPKTASAAKVSPAATATAAPAAAAAATAAPTTKMVSGLPTVVYTVTATVTSRETITLRETVTSRETVTVIITEA
ncbi:hypothetical protein MY3296_008096 [Beauveria thailandica]